jgi:glycosyltransferase involved in cell wall biosynthesis
VSRRRCLLVETLPYHWEVLPSWVGMLRRLGYEVEVAASEGTPGHRETLALLRSRCRTHRVSDVESLPLDAFDFVVVNTLVHEGYLFSRPLERRPSLEWIRDLGRPSIAVIHEPEHWVEKRITHSFDEASGQGRRRVALLADGSVQHQTGSCSLPHWSFEGSRLHLPGEGGARLFESRDGGRTYRGLDADRGTSLVRRDVAMEDLAGHCAAGRHAVVATTEVASAHLGAVCDAEWILPLEVPRRPAGRPAGEIAFAGTLNWDRKAILSLLDGCTALRDGEYIRIIGGSRDADFDNDRVVAQVRRLITERGLDARFRFSGYLPYGDYLAAIRRCRFLLPLVDDAVDAGAYLLKLPAAVASSLALGVPLILNRTIAERFGMEYMVCYPGGDLASGLRAQQALGDGDYAAMLDALHRHARALWRRNLAVLAGLIERITGHTPAGAVT